MAAILLQLMALGFISLDPVGIAAMPMLLAQQRGLLKALSFLAGSFVAMVVAGVILANGAGLVLVKITKEDPKLEPTVEMISGLILLVTAAVIVLRARNKTHVANPPPPELSKNMSLSPPRLFLYGVVIVILQSLVDIVFVLAMVNTGTKKFELYIDVFLVSCYAFAALAVQIVIVVLYLVAPSETRGPILENVERWITLRKVPLAAGAATLVGLLLMANGVSTLHGGPDLFA